MASDVEGSGPYGAPALRMPHVSADTLRRLRRGLALLQSVSPALAARAALKLFLTPTRRALNPADSRDLARARRHELRAGPRRFCVHEWGKGPRTAVILHGWGSHAARFATLARPLQAQGWRILAIDAPGHGQSGGGSSSLPEFGAALEATIDEFGPARLLIGHSLGALAITMRLGSLDSVKSAAEATRLRAAVLIAMPDGAPFLLDRFIAMMELHEPAENRLREQFIARFGHPPEAFTALRDAAHIRVPVLLVHDAEDDVVPVSHSQAMQAAIPGSRLLVTHGLGHSGMLRDQETIAAIARFAMESCDD